MNYMKEKVRRVESVALGGMNCVESLISVLSNNKSFR